MVLIITDASYRERCQLIEKLSRKTTEKRSLMNPDNTVALGVRRKRLKRIKE